MEIEGVMSCCCQCVFTTGWMSVEKEIPMTNQVKLKGAMKRFWVGMFLRREGQIVDFIKRTEIAVVDIYFKQEEEHKMMYTSGGSCTQVDRSCNLKRDRRQ